MQPPIQVIFKSEQLDKNERETIDNYLSMAFSELNRLTTLSQNVSRFSNMTSDDDSLIDLNDIIERTCHLMLHDERMWKVALNVQLDKSIPAIKLVNDRFIQVLQNLIGNAIDACEDHQEGAKITVSSTIKGNNIIVCIADNGHGMSPQTLSQAGREFFTTK